MDVAEANQIALSALRAVLVAAHPFELGINGKSIRVSSRAPVAASWPKEPKGLDEQRDGPWPSPILLDCEWAGGRVTLEMRASVWRGSKRYNGQVALQVVTSPLNREILWSTMAARILAAVVALRGEPVQVELPESFQRVLSDLERLLTGRIETEHGRFLFKRAGDRFDMAQVAEGIKKIGIFTRLIQNGSLRRNSILFIDEPETNLHPRAARDLVRMLYDLSLAGVQIYAATHSYFVLKQFELIARKHDTSVQLCCLSRAGDEIESRFFDLRNGMPENGIVEEALRLYDEDIETELES